MDLTNNKIGNPIDSKERKIEQKQIKIKTMSRQLKQYYFNVPIDFGMYKGEILQEIIEKNGSYIKWCVLNVDYFFVALEDLQECYDKMGWILSDDAKLALAKKEQRLAEFNQCDEVDVIEDSPRSWDQDELEIGDWEYDRHNPAHSPSENPWIDVFGAGEEAEAAYWNTD